jgi:hypothetical protein
MKFDIKRLSFLIVSIAIIIVCILTIACLNAKEPFAAILTALACSFLVLIGVNYCPFWGFIIWFIVFIVSQNLFRYFYFLWIYPYYLFYLSPIFYFSYGIWSMSIAFAARKIKDTIVKVIISTALYIIIVGVLWPFIYFYFVFNYTGNIIKLIDLQTFNEAGLIFVFSILVLKIHALLKNIS